MDTTNYLSDLPLDLLREMLRATERSAGPNAQGARILRRIIARQEQDAMKTERGESDG